MTIIPSGTDWGALMGLTFWAASALWAQANMDGLTPILTLVVQGGSLALLAVIIVKIGPDIAKGQSEERDRREKESREERERRDAAFVGLVNVLQERFESRNALLVAAIERQTATFVQAISRNSEVISHAVVNTAHEMAERVVPTGDKKPKGS